MRHGTFGGYAYEVEDLNEMSLVCTNIMNCPRHCLSTFSHGQVIFKLHHYNYIKSPTQKFKFLYEELGQDKPTCHSWLG